MSAHKIKVAANSILNLTYLDVLSVKGWIASKEAPARASEVTADAIVDAVIAWAEVHQQPPS